MSSRLAAAFLPVALASAASGQVLINEHFEVDEATSGFTCNGQQMLFGGGNPGRYIGIPLDTFFGVSLRTEEPGNAMTGNLARHGGAIRIAFDVRVFTLRNFFGDDVDPSHFPVVLEAFDDPEIPGEGVPVSVYTIGPSLPAVASGWTRFEFIIPDPTQTALPQGWGGTGDEDPVTFEPRLPANRTYADVLAQVDRLQISTMQPGFFYTFNFWEVGFDNLHIEVVTPPGCPADFNGDGELNPDDLSDYITCFFTEAGTPGSCPAADFSGDGNIDPDDLSDYITAFFAGC